MMLKNMLHLLQQLGLGVPEFLDLGTTQDCSHLQYLLYFFLSLPFILHSPSSEKSNRLSIERHLT